MNVENSKMEERYVLVYIKKTNQQIYEYISFFRFTFSYIYIYIYIYIFDWT